MHQAAESRRTARAARAGDRPLLRYSATASCRNSGGSACGSSIPVAGRPSSSPDRTVPTQTLGCPRKTWAVHQSADPRVAGFPATAVFLRVGRVRRSGLWASCPSGRFSCELVPQTIGFLEGAKAIEDGERLPRARRGLHVVTHEPFGAGPCS